MKNLVNYLLLFSLFATTLVNAQVKIGDNPEAIDQSSILELESNSKAFVITRLSEAAMNAITPLHGALVYNTDAGCVFYYNGSQWSNLCEDDNTTNVSLTLEDALLTLTDSDGNEVSVPLAGAVEQTFTANPIVNFRETIIITQDGNNYNFEVGEITGDNIVDSSINGIDIQDNSITQDQLAPNSVGQNELEENAVADNEIDYSQVTLNDFTNDAGYITTAEIISADAGNDITDQNGAYYDDSLLQDAITTNATAVNNHINNDQDTAIDNEVVTQFEIVGNDLVLTEAGVPYSVSLAGFNNSGSDDQTLAEVLTEGNSAGNQLIRDVNDPQIAQDAATKNYVDNAIASIPTGSDNQNLSLAGSNLNISGGTGVDLGPLLSSGADGLISNVALVGNNLQFTGTGAAFNGNVSVASLVNTDSQNLTGATLNGANLLTIDIQNGGSTSVDLSSLAGGASDGAITGVILNGTDLEFTGAGTGFNGSVPLASLQDGFEANTDNQNLANVLVQGNDAGGVQIENLLDPNDNQDAATKKYVDDSVVAAGGGVPTDELITDFALNTTTLTITEDGVNWPVDLDPTFVTEVELTNGLNTIDGSETIVTAGTNVTVNGTGTAGDPYIIDATAATADGSETIVNGSATVNVTGTGTAGDPYVLTSPDTSDGSETIVTAGTNVTVNGTGTAGDPYIIDATAATADGSETIVNGSATVNVTGTGTAGDPYVLTSPDTSDGSETIVTAGTNVTVNGTGTAGDPYIIDATAATADGSETIVNGSATVNVTGTGTAGDPYVLTSPDTSDGSETIVTAGTNVTVNGTGTAGDPYIIDATAATADGSETIVNGSATVNVTGTGTAGDPYVLTSPDTSDGSETIVTAGTNVTVNGTGTAGDPYIIDATAATADGSETIVNGSATVNVTGTGTAGDPYVLTSPDTSDGSETIVTAGTNVTVNGTGTAGDPYIIDATAATADGSETIVNGSATVNVTGTGTAGDPYIVSVNEISGGPSGQIATNSITQGDIDVNAVGAAEIDSNAVSSDEIDDLSITNIDIANATIQSTKLAPGGADQILRTNAAGTLVEWVALPGGGSYTAGNGINIAGSTISADVDGSTINFNGNQLYVPDGGITTAQIQDGTIQQQDLSDMGGAGPGQVLKYNGTVWAAATDNDTQYTGGVGIDVTGTDISISLSELSESVTTNEILNGTIQNIDIAGGAAIDGSKINPVFTAQINATLGITTGADIFLNGNMTIPDYVFENYYEGFSTLNDSYNFKKLSEIEAFIKKHKHLPGITSAYQAQKDGQWNLSQSNLQNLEKIEELFLHTIEQEKKIKALQQENTTLSKELDALKKDMALIKEMLAAKKE